MAIAPTLAMDQCAISLRTPGPIMPGKGIIYCSLQWGIPLGWVSYFKPLCEGKLLSHHWDPIVLLQPDLLKHTILEWNMPHWKRREGEGSGLECPAPIHLLTPDSSAHPQPWSTCVVCTTRSSSLSWQLLSPQGQVGTFCSPLVWSFGCYEWFFFFFNKFIYLFIYFWLCWVFVAACGLSLVAMSGGYSSLWCAGFSL